MTRVLRHTTTLVGALAAGAAGLVGLAWGTACVVLWWLQEALIFPAPGGIDRSALDQTAAEVGAEPFALTADDGVPLYAWRRARPPTRSTPCAVLYLHGNGETVAGSARLGQAVSRAGCDFSVVAWRGYPGSGGRPSEDGLRRDARALWDHVTGTAGIPAERVVVHGRSLGGGVAVQLAAAVQPGAVVLESTFRSVRAIAAASYPWLPVNALLRHPFDSEAVAPRIERPTLVLHGTADHTIPVAHGRTLADVLPRARYREIPDVDHDQSLALGAARDDYLGLVRWAGSPAPGPVPPGW